MQQQPFPGTGNSGNLPSPLFQPRPGWGGQLARWFRENAYVIVFRLVLLVAVVVIVGSLLRGGSDAPQEGSDPFASNAPFPLDKPITLKAEYGEGVTHMAARAVDLFILTRSEADAQLDAPRHLFAVDRLSREAGWRPLKLGEKIWFPIDIIARIVREARELTVRQYQAWTKLLLP